MNHHEVRVFADASELGLRAGESATRAINDAVRRGGRCAVALSGGHTPRLLYELLGTTFRDQIPWASVDVFWVDERFVPVDHRESNYRMAREALLDHVPCPAENVHPMPTSCPTADDAASDYERTLRAYFADGVPRFDLIILGLGTDGHTASLFPKSPALNEQERWVVAVTAPVQPPLRLTLTLPVLTQATNIFVLVTGATKATALHHALAPAGDPAAIPAVALHRAEGSLTWWVDRDARASSNVILR